MDQYFENNRQLWNRRAALHKESDFYDLKGFLQGETSLKSVEIKALGSVVGKSLLHLQCHFGLDTLSFERLGAEVTGVDFSEEAIGLAKSIRDEQGMTARFINSNVYDLDKHLNDRFDVVFTSYGVICWLNDINSWARIVSQFLKPGGVFYIIEFHPVIMMFNEDTGEMIYPYFHQDEPIEQIVQYTYANPDELLDHKEYSWNHSLADVVNALIDNGLVIDRLEEYPFSSYNCFPDLVAGKDGYFWHKKNQGNIPLMFSISATKPI